MVPLLRKSLRVGYAIHDFDERGVPKNVDATWRKKETRYWIGVAVRNAKHNKSTIISGLTTPNEVRQARKGRSLGVRICLLDVNRNVMRKRLLKRFQTPARIRNLKAVTGLTVAECIRDNLAHARVLRKECRKYHVKFFNTSKTTAEKTADKLMQWITKS